MFRLILAKFPRRQPNISEGLWKELDRIYKQIRIIRGRETVIKVENSDLLNGWQNFENNHQGFQIHKQGEMVHITGLVKSGTAGAAIYVLPEGYRPSGHVFSTVTSSGGAERIYILEDGTVRQDSAATANTYLGIDAHFQVE